MGKINSAHRESGHVIGYNTYILNWLGLLALTCATVSLAGMNLGRWIIITALTIASIKSVLVLNTFMHLKYEGPLFKIFVGVAVMTFIIFISLTFFDYAFQ